MKIFSPVKTYTGMSASVSFCNGIGETEDPHLIEWFKEHGYEVEEAEKDTVTVEAACVEDSVETETEKQDETPKTKHTRK